MGNYVDGAHQGATGLARWNHTLHSEIANNSLDGKCKTVQAKITEDMSQLDPDDEVNIYDLLQTYATQMSALGYSGSNKYSL